MLYFKGHSEQGSDKSGLTTTQWVHDNKTRSFQISKQWSR